MCISHTLFCFYAIHKNAEIHSRTNTTMKGDFYLGNCPYFKVEENKMKKNKTLALTIASLLAMTGCANNASSSTETAANGNFSDEMKMNYTFDLSPEDGADSVERDGDHTDSIYFAHPDFYNMESTETLTIIPHFKTTQQTSEWACGVTSALMVMNYYGKADGLTEESLAELRHSLDGTELEGYPGTTLNQEIDMFEKSGFDVVSTNDKPEGLDFDEIQDYLKEGKPIAVCWIDWGGHWQVIIGYDNMGTETTQDDVIIVADPYDTTDHNQDGYGIYGAERFVYNWSMHGYFTEEEGGNDGLFVVATPQK